MDFSLLLFGAVMGGTGVALGAFGAHALQARLPPDLLAAFETGVRYQLVHAVTLVTLATVARQVQSSLWRAAGWLFVIGCVLFSGSLYALALSGTRTLGLVTPFGGVAFLAGWTCLAIAAWRGERA